MTANDERALFEAQWREINKPRAYAGMDIEQGWAIWQAARKPASAEPTSLLENKPLAWLYTHCLAIGMTKKSDSGLPEHDIALFTTDLQLAAPRPENPVLPVEPDGWVLVPRQVVQDVCTLAHNYSLNAIAPDYYHGVERDAFANAYKRCGSDLAKIRAALAVLPSSPR